VSTSSPPQEVIQSPSRAAFDLDLARNNAGGWVGWRGPLAVTALAALIRLPYLGQPKAIIFDETYYVKDSLSLLNFGYERKVIENADAALLASDGINYQSIFTDAASYVVHPPVGKWIIASGESLFGATPFGWRIAVAVLGILSVLLTARIARRLTNSNAIGTIAGLLLALDGLHIAMSRTCLLYTSDAADD
jgi:dolichyl-phosphate-mannose-protein mannosyltransferase